MFAAGAYMPPGSLTVGKHTLDDENSQKRSTRGTTTGGR